MLGTIVNTLAIIVGSLLGIVFMDKNPAFSKQGMIISPLAWFRFSLSHK